MKTIRLYGDMGRRFGREFVLDVKTPAEAVAALCAVVDGFRAYLHEHAQDAFKVFVGGRNTSDVLADPCSDREIIRIAPVVQGASAVGRIVVGAVLIAVSFIPGPWTPYTMSAGISMVLGGVAELLAPKVPTASPNEAPANKPNYLFDGPVNTTAQGHPVPIAYGRLMVGSAVVSAGMATVDVGTNATGDGTIFDGAVAAFAVLVDIMKGK